MLVPLFTGPAERNVRYARPTTTLGANCSTNLFVSSLARLFLLFITDDQGNRKDAVTDRKAARVFSLLCPTLFKIDGPTNFDARVSLSIVSPIKDLGALSSRKRLLQYGSVCIFFVCGLRYGSHDMSSGLL